MIFEAILVYSQYHRFFVFDLGISIKNQLSKLIPVPEYKQ